MSEFFVYSVGKSNGGARPAPVSFPESHHAPVEPDRESKPAVSNHTYPGNTRLIFKIDETNHNVVVMIVDETSSEVIRTVPGDAIEEIRSGELIQKNA